MVRAPAFNKNGIKKGAWSEEEDEKLRAYVLRYGHWNWHLVPKFAGLSRCGKSCRLRWVNYLRPDVKRGNFTKEEDELIVKLREQLGNRWSMIASNIPGRTDNEVKNRWHTRLKKQYAKQLKNQSGRLSLAGVVEGVCLPLEKLRFKLQFLLATGPTGSLSNDRHQSAAKSKEQSGETKQSEIFVNVERVVGGVLPNSSNTPSDVFLESSSQPPETFSSGFYNLNSDSAQVALSDAIWVPEDTLRCSGDFWTEPFITDASTTCETLPMSFEQCGCTSSFYYYDDFLY